MSPHSNPFLEALESKLECNIVISATRFANFAYQSLIVAVNESDASKERLWKQLQDLLTAAADSVIAESKVSVLNIRVTIGLLRCAPRRSSERAQTVTGNCFFAAGKLYDQLYELLETDNSANRELVCEGLIIANALIKCTHGSSKKKVRQERYRTLKRAMADLNREIYLYRNNSTSVMSNSDAV